MNTNKLFIENSRVNNPVDIPNIRKKNDPIINQKVRNRYRIKRHRSTKKQPRLVEKLRDVPKRYKGYLQFILWVSITLVFVLSSLPFYHAMRSFLWEREQKVESDDGLVYELFLQEGMGKKGEKGSRANLSVVLPEFRVISYRVKKGDSLFGIAHKFNTSIDGIITANGLRNAYYLQIGKLLKVPSKSGIFYTVKRGDTLSKIAQVYKVKITRIADINDLSSSTLTIGQKIFIPGASLTQWERAAAIGNIFKPPAKGRLTSRMGFRIDPFTKKIAYHTGIDIANRRGTPVHAAQFGRVIYKGYRGNYGKTIIIAHPHGYTTLYGHLRKIMVRRGQIVTQGQIIGAMGNTGRSTGPHLHFEVHQNGKLVNPLKVIRLN